MALVDNAWYVNYGDGSAGAGKKSWFDVTAWTTGTVIAAGALIRQSATPTVGNERVFVCIVAGTTHATTEPTWTITRGGKTTDNTVTWQEVTGNPAVNGDATNTATWTITATPPGGVKGTAVTLGQVIKRDSGASYQICSTAGTAGSGAEPAFSNTAGVTTADNTVTWTSLGVVGNFTGWQAPHQRILNALGSGWSQVGNTIYVGDNHAETRSTSYDLTAGGGTVANPIKVLCVDRAGSLPPVAADLKTTATVSVTGATFIAFSFNGGGVYYRGIIFQLGSSTNAGTCYLCVSNTSTQLLVFENCQFFMVGTGSGTFNFGNSFSQSTLGSVVYFINTSLKFSAVGQTIGFFGARLYWRDTPSAIQGSALPTNLFNPGSAPDGTLFAHGVDFSALGSGKTLFNMSGSWGLQAVLNRCALGASVTIGTVNTVGPFIDLINCDSAGVNYRNERYRYNGTQTIDTTIIRTGGATNGTTTISWKIVTTANVKWLWPFESQQISLWNDSTAAITTLTFYGTTTGGGVPNNDDIWVEVEYMASSSNPQGSFITTTKANILSVSAATNNSSDASTWAGGGAGNGFKIVVPSFTPAMKGPINIRFKVAKASATYYLDPTPYISGVPVSKSYITAGGLFVNELSSGDRFSGGLFI